MAALALVLIGSQAGAASGQSDTACRGDHGEFLQRLRAGWFDFAVLADPLIPRRTDDHSGAVPPRQLAALGLRSAADAAGLPQRLGVAPGACRSAWTLWTRLASKGRSPARARWMYVVVMSPPESASAAGTEEFERYYAGQHLGEVVAEIGYLRGSLFAAVPPPDSCWRHAPGRYLAIYEAAGKKMLQRQAARVQAMAGMRFDGAPSDWASRLVAWRAAFRVVAPPGPISLDSLAPHE